jgi:hypothetical protein
VQSQRRYKYGILTGVAVYAAFLIALIAAFAFYQFPQSLIGETFGTTSDAASYEARQVGTILIPREVGGDCRQVKFDNRTGAVQEVSIVECDGGTATTNMNSTVGRLNAIRAAFSKK